MPLQRKKHEVFYNTKTKVYRTGATSTIYCQDYIFRDSSAEDVQKRHDDQLNTRFAPSAKSTPCIQEAPHGMHGGQLHKTVILCS